MTHIRSCTYVYGIYLDVFNSQGVAPKADVFKFHEFYVFTALENFLTF